MHIMPHKKIGSAVTKISTRRASFSRRPTTPFPRGRVRWEVQMNKFEHVQGSLVMRFSWGGGSQGVPMWVRGGGRPVSMSRK